jgi:hypothetical protein
VIQAVDDHGKAVLVEWCVLGKGTIGLTAALFPDEPIVALPSTGTRNRLHVCPRPAVLDRAFSAANFTGEKAGQPNNYYRPSGAARRGGKK